MNTQTLTVQITKAEFDPEADVVRFHTLLPDKSPYTFSWPTNDFGYAIGLTKKGVRIPEKLLIPHLDDLTARQKFFTWRINTIDLNDADHDQIDKAMKQVMEGRNG